MDPTTFETDPSVVQANVTAPAAASSLDTMSGAQADSAAPVVRDNESAEFQEANTAPWTAVDTLTLMAAILSLAVVIAFGIAETHRERGSQIPA